MRLAGVPMGCLYLCVWLGFQWDVCIYVCGWGSNGMFVFMCEAGVPMGCLNLCVRLGFQWDAWMYVWGWSSNGMLEFMCEAGVPMGCLNLYVRLGFQWDVWIFVRLGFPWDAWSLFSFMYIDSILQILKPICCFFVFGIEFFSLQACEATLLHHFMSNMWSKVMTSFEVWGSFDVIRMPLGNHTTGCDPLGYFICTMRSPSKTIFKWSWTFYYTITSNSTYKQKNELSRVAANSNASPLKYCPPWLTTFVYLSWLALVSADSHWSSNRQDLPTLCSSAMTCNETTQMGLHTEVKYKLAFLGISDIF